MVAVFSVQCVSDPCKAIFINFCSVTTRRLLKEKSTQVLLQYLFRCVSCDTSKACQDLFLNEMLFSFIGMPALLHSASGT